MGYTFPCVVWDTDFGCTVCISVPTESSLCCSSCSSAFACVQGQDLKEGVVWEAILGGSNKTNALSDTY